MPTDFPQIILATLEFTLLLVGAGLVLWLLFSPRQRTRWFRTHALSHWQVTLPEFLFCALLVFCGGFLLQTLAHTVLSSAISQSPEKSGLELFVYGAGFHGGILLGCLFFPTLRRQLYRDYGTEPPPVRSTPALPWATVLRYAAGTLLVALPILTLLSLGWTELLRSFGLPDDPQDLIAVFTQTKSPLVIAGMFIVACCLAPLSEELIFRAGLYRYIRQKLGRTPALLTSGICFGALHANWAGFLPLAVLGMLLALVYEATGSIRVAVVAHALFNFNTIIIVLSGLQQLNS